MNNYNPTFALPCIFQINKQKTLEKWNSLITLLCGTLENSSHVVRATVRR